MGRGERRMRMQRMRHHVMDHNIYRWAASILGDLRDLRIENAEGADITHAGPVAVPTPRKAHRKLA
jgi:trehalose-6-phosphate synthase